MPLPYFPLYVDDYEADTAHLTITEDGAYSRLLRLCWRTPGCTIPDDADWIKRRMRVSDEEFVNIVRPIIDEYFAVKNGRVYSERLLKEWQKSDLAHRKRKNAGRKGGLSKSLKNKEKDSSNALATRTRTRTIESPPVSPPEGEGQSRLFDDQIDHDQREPDPPPPKPRKKTNRGSRLPEDWQPSERNLQDAGAEGLSPVEISREAEKFRDYWISKPGATACKLDWAATWRNWIRKSREMGGGGRGGGQSRIAQAAARHIAGEPDPNDHSLAAVANRWLGEVDDEDPQAEILDLVPVEGGRRDGT